MTPDSTSYSSVDTSSSPLEHSERTYSPTSPTSYKHDMNNSEDVTPRHDVARNATFVSSISSSFSKEEVPMIAEDAEVLEAIHQPPNDYDRQRIKTPEANVNARNSAGQSPLSISSSKCFLEGMKLLIDKGADINLQDIYQRTPLLLACENIGSSVHHDCVQYLLANGASVHLCDVYGRTPLHVATMAGCVECINLLLDHGATSDVKNEEGNTPLHVAAMMGQVACMEALSHETRCDINDDNDSHSSVEPLIFDQEGIETEYNDNFVVVDSFYQSPRGTSFRVSPIPRRTSFVDVTKNLGVDNLPSNGDTPQFRNDSAYFSARGSAWIKSKYISDAQVDKVVESSSTHSYSTSSSSAAAAADDEYESDVDSLNGSDPYVIEEDSISLVLRLFLHIGFYFRHVLFTWSMRIYNLSKRSRNAFDKCSKSTTEGDGPQHMECTPIRSNRAPGDPSSGFVQPPAHVAEAMEKLRLSRLSKQEHGL